MPTFKKNPSGFKMKGYTYPGVSPLTKKLAKVSLRKLGRKKDVYRSDAELDELDAQEALGVRREKGLGSKAKQTIKKKKDIKEREAQKKRDEARGLFHPQKEK